MDSDPFDQITLVFTQARGNMSEAARNERATMAPDDERYIGHIIVDVARLLRTVCDRRVRKIGLTRAQWLAVARLHHRPGLSQSEVADLLEVENATACRLLDRLESKKWIERRLDKNDRRVKRIYLTPRANRVYASISPIAESTIGEALQELSPDEQKKALQYDDSAEGQASDPCGTRNRRLGKWQQVATRKSERSPSDLDSE